MRVPEIFRSVRSLDFSFAELEAAQRTFNECGIYDRMRQIAVRHFTEKPSRAKRAISVLDLCAATGLASWELRTLGSASVTLVDTDCTALKAAKARFAKSVFPVRSVVADATTWRPDNAEIFDLVLMSSAYHHIPDHSKATFLQHAFSMVAPGGLLLLGDHFLPAYDGVAGHPDAALDFYAALLTELARRGEPSDALFAMAKAGFRSWLRAGEFKVDWRRFSEHAEFLPVFEEVVTVWSPIANPDTRIGTYVVAWVKQDEHE